MDIKKTLLFSALVVSALSFAQISFSETRFGVTAGGNYSQVTNAHNPSGPRYTLQGGIIALVPIGKDNQFYIQSEILYYGAGESGKDRRVKGRDGYNALYANNYLSIPVFFKVYTSKDRSAFFGMIGPRFNFLLSQKVKNVPLDRSYYDPDISDPKHPEIDGKANPFNFGISYGIGYSHNRNIEVILKYDMGISNTYPRLIESWTGSPNTGKSKSEQVISLGVSFLLTKDQRNP